MRVFSFYVLAAALLPTVLCNTEKIIVSGSDLREAPTVTLNGVLSRHILSLPYTATPPITQPSKKNKTSEDTQWKTQYFLLRPAADQWPTGHKAEVRVNWPANRPAAFQLKLVRGRKDPGQILVQVKVQREGVPVPGVGKLAEREPIIFSIVFESLLFGVLPVSSLRPFGQILVTLLVGVWWVYPAVKSLLKSLQKKASAPLPSSSSPKKTL